MEAMVGRKSCSSEMEQHGRGQLGTLGSRLSRAQATDAWRNGMARVRNAAAGADRQTGRERGARQTAEQQDRDLTRNHCKESTNRGVRREVGCECRSRL